MKPRFQILASAWRGFWRLGNPERGIALEAAAVLLATRIGLRIAGFKRWKRILEVFTPAPPRDPDGPSPSLAAARAIARVGESAAGYVPFPASCLERSLTVWWLLRRRGVTAEIRAGARKSEDRFEAHAWVECRGAILTGGEEGEFVPFDGPITMQVAAR